KEKTGCEPYCAIPFGYNKEVIIVVDDDIFKHDKFIYSPGPPEKTIEIDTKDVSKILDSVENQVIHV
ncbi:MAG: YbaK/EbsC family protein, partial [Candidatus Aenigmarchaeota archaeon]|nr:YbaK/EbsC family protein [Candidatus Aenigmarchaeota archaeon]